MAGRMIPQKFEEWVKARQRFHLSDAHVAMARELGLNPRKLGDKTNHRQEPWKAPLPEFIESLYLKQFGKPRPDNVRSLEQIVADRKEKMQKKRDQRQREETPSSSNPAL